jgi:hypothetical protein
MGSPPPPYLPHGKAGGDHKMKYKIKKLLKKTYNMYREFVSLESVDVYGRICFGANFLGGNKDQHPTNLTNC